MRIIGCNYTYILYIYQFTLDKIPQQRKTRLFLGSTSISSPVCKGQLLPLPTTFSAKTGSFCVSPSSPFQLHHISPSWKKTLKIRLRFDSVSSLTKKTSQSATKKRCIQVVTWGNPFLFRQVSEKSWRTKNRCFITPPIWVFPKMVVPPKHPKMVIFSRKTHGCWVPAF